MNIIKKTTKFISVLDIVVCLFVLFYSFALPSLVNNDIYLVRKFAWCTFLVAFMLAIIVIAFFVLLVIVNSILCRKVVKEKSVILALIVNALFISLLIIFIIEYDLWFIFA